MKKFTNHTPGLRGITVNSDTGPYIKYLEPGASVMLDPALVLAVPDLGKPGAAAADGAATDTAAEHAAEIDRLKDEHTAELNVASDRAVAAEGQLAEARAEIDRLKEEAAFATPVEIKMAVALLDKDEASHWTKEGKPSVDAVKALVGKDVSREQIAAVAPDAKRPTA